jgi:hypothetical protein
MPVLKHKNFKLGHYRVNGHLCALPHPFPETLRRIRNSHTVVGNSCRFRMISFLARDKYFLAPKLQVTDVSAGLHSVFLQSISGS